MNLFGRPENLVGGADRMGQARANCERQVDADACPAPSVASTHQAPKPQRRSVAGLEPDEMQSFVPASERGNRLEAVTAFMQQFQAEQRAKRKRYNDVSNQRKRDRELEAATASARAPR